MCDTAVAAGCVTASTPQVPIIPECPPGVPSQRQRLRPGWPRSSCPHTHRARQLLISAFQSPAPLSTPFSTPWVFWKSKHQPTEQPHGWGDVFPCQSAERKRENISAHVRSFHQTHVHSMGHRGPFSLSLATSQYILFEKFPWAETVKAQQFCKLEMQKIENSQLLAPEMAAIYAMCSTVCKGLNWQSREMRVKITAPTITLFCLLVASKAWYTSFCKFCKIWFAMWHLSPEQLDVCKRQNQAITWMYSFINPFPF